MEASCQCGLTHLQIPHAKPTALVICHCNKCRLITGSVFNINAVFPYFEVPDSVTSSTSIFKQGSDSGNVLNGHFCKGCGNRMFYTDGTGGRGFLSVSAPRIADMDVGQVVRSKDTVHVWTRTAVVPESMWDGCVSFAEQPPLAGLSEMVGLEGAESG